MITNSDPVKSISQPEILVAEGLRKSYGPRKALKELTFSLPERRREDHIHPHPDHHDGA
jgi:hypothetical protein